MDDRERRLADLREHLDAMTPDEREEVRTFLARFDQRVERKVEQLLWEARDPDRLSDDDLHLRNRLLSDEVPLVNPDGQRYFKPRASLTLQDTVAFGRFQDRDAERRQREILGGLGDSSEN
jgi:hypothetical protein